MKFNKDELWLVYDSLYLAAAESRARDFQEQAKIFEKLANKIEKELK